MASRERTGTGVVIVAAGAGSRFGGKTPKQFAMLEGKSLIQRSVEFFAGLRGIRTIVLVVPSRYMQRVARVFRGKRSSHNLVIVAGGRRRQDSVWNGLRALDPEPKLVLIHDAVRPFVTRRMVTSLVREARRHSAAIPALPVTDTIKQEEKRGFLTATVDRSRLRAAQTPQCYDFGLLVNAHRRVRKRGLIVTDDAAAIESLGIPVRIVEGNPWNIKITTTSDLAVAKIWLRTARKGNVRGLQL